MKEIFRFGMEEYVDNRNLNIEDILIHSVYRRSHITKNDKIFDKERIIKKKNERKLKILRY